MLESQFMTSFVIAFALFLFLTQAKNAEVDIGGEGVVGFDEFAEQGNDEEFEIYTGRIDANIPVRPRPQFRTFSQPRLNEKTLLEYADLVLSDPDIIIESNPFSREEILARSPPQVHSSRQPRRRRARSLNIFGPDDRYDVDEFAFPNSASGFFYSVYGFCSGQLVGSRYTMVTNNHCAEEYGDLFWEQARFLPGYSADGFGSFTSLGLGYLVHVIRSAKYDYAVYQLSPLTPQWPTSHVGYWYFPSDSVFENHDFSVFQIAYSGDHAGLANTDFDFNGGKEFAQAKRSECTTRGLDDWRVMHDCDSLKGSSGSALVLPNNMAMVALNFRSKCPTGDCDKDVYFPSWAASSTNLAIPIRYVKSAIQLQNAKQPVKWTPYPTPPSRRPTLHPTTPYPSLRPSSPTTRSPTPFGFVVNSKRTWYEADRFCRSKNSFLSTVQTVDQLNALYDVWKNTFQFEPMWVGLNDVAQVRVSSQSRLGWIWPSGAVYNDILAFWQYGEPHASDPFENCVMFRKGQIKKAFGNAPCETRAYFRCD